MGHFGWPSGTMPSGIPQRMNAVAVNPGISRGAGFVQRAFFLANVGVKDVETVLPYGLGNAEACNGLCRLVERCDPFVEIDRENTVAYIFKDSSEGCFESRGDITKDRLVSCSRIRSTSLPPPFVLH